MCRNSTRTATLRNDGTNAAGSHPAPRLSICGGSTSDRRTWPSVSPPTLDALIAVIARESGASSNHKPGVTGCPAFTRSRPWPTSAAIRRAKSETSDFAGHDKTVIHLITDESLRGPLGDIGAASLSWRHGGACQYWQDEIRLTEGLPPENCAASDGMKP